MKYILYPILALLYCLFIFSLELIVFVVAGIPSYLWSFKLSDFTKDIFVADRISSNDIFPELNSKYAFREEHKFRAAPTIFHLYYQELILLYKTKK